MEARNIPEKKIELPPTTYDPRKIINNSYDFGGIVELHSVIDQQGPQFCRYGLYVSNNLDNLNNYLACKEKEPSRYFIVNLDNPVLGQYTDTIIGPGIYEVRPQRFLSLKTLLCKTPLEMSDINDKAENLLGVNVDKLNEIVTADLEKIVIQKYVEDIKSHKAYQAFNKYVLSFRERIKEENQKGIIFKSYLAELDSITTFNKLSTWVNKLLHFDQYLSQALHGRVSEYDLMLFTVKLGTSDPKKTKSYKKLEKLKEAIENEILLKVFPNQNRTTVSAKYLQNYTFSEWEDRKTGRKWSINSKPMG